MNIERWNPFREFDDWFRDYHRGMMKRWDERDALSATDWMPAVDILENDKEYQLKVEIPEIPKDDVKIAVNNGMLTISGERKQENRDDKQHRIERYYGHFSRSFSLPDDVQPEDISATFKDGMLYVHMTKSEPKEKVRQIEIQ